MSPVTRKPEYLVLTALGIVSLAVILVLSMRGYLHEPGQAWPPWRTTHTTNREGMLAFYLLLERFGVHVDRLDSPPLKHALDPVDVLLLIDPQLPLDEESEELVSWIRRGGVLVTSGDFGPSLKQLLGAPPKPMEKDPPDETNTRPSPDRTSTTHIPDDRAALPLARDVAALEMETTLVLHPDEDAPREPIAPLLIDSLGLRVADRPVGAGRVIVLADSSFLANGWIDKHDNAIAAANLIHYALAHAEGNRVSFDEYHFGYGRLETRWHVLSNLLFTNSAGWSVLSLTFAGTLFLVYKGRRFGTRRPPGRPRRRSKLEYVKAVGATFKAAGARGITLALLFESFRSKASARLGLPPGASPQEIAAALARRTGKPLAPYDATLTCCANVIDAFRRTARPPSAWELSSVARRLAEIETEVFHGHRNGKRERP